MSEDGDGGASTPPSPASASSSFRVACERIPEARSDDTPRTAGGASAGPGAGGGALAARARGQRGRAAPTSSAASITPDRATAFPDMFLRSRSSAGTRDAPPGRFREHGPAFDSTRRSVSSCSFGRAKRQICEHLIKEKMERIPQEVIRHDQHSSHGDRNRAGQHRQSQDGSLGRAERGHWSQRKELLPDKWSRRVQYGHHSPPGSPHERSAIFHRTSFGNQEMHDFFAGKTTFGTDKKWYQRKPTEAGPGPAGVRPPQTRIKGGRFNRHRSLTFIEQAQRLGGTLPGPGLYNPQDAGIYAVPGGRFNVSKPMTHWQLIEKDARSKPSGADTTCNTPWGQNNNPFLPGAGGPLPQGGRIINQATQPGIEKLYAPRVYLIRTPEREALMQTPGPGAYNPS